MPNPNAPPQTVYQGIKSPKSKAPDFTHNPPRFPSAARVDMKVDPTA